MYHDTRRQNQSNGFSVANLYSSGLNNSRPSLRVEVGVSSKGKTLASKVWNQVQKVRFHQNF